MQNQLTKREKNTYMFAALGQGAIYAMMASWLGRFYTDVFQLNGFFIGALMWAARIWDAVNDPMMGIIVDRTRTKWGKMRPYLLISPPIAALLTILIFIKPNFGPTGLMIYAAITYIIWGMVYTVGDVPFWGLPSAMTHDSKERAKFISNSRTLNSIGSALPLVLVSVLFTENMLGIRYGILVSAIIFAVCGGALYMRTFFVCKERIIPPKEIPSVKESLGLVKQNKPLIIAVLVGVLAFGRYMVQGVVSYAADYVFVANGFLDKNMVLVTSALIGIGMFPAMLFMPALFKRFNYKQIVIGSGAMSLIIGVSFFFASYYTGYNAWIALPFLFISGLPLGVFNVITYAIIADSIDYLEWKTGKRAEGLSFSTQTFMNKLGAAISAGLIPVMLQAFGYIPPIDKVLQEQPGDVKFVIFFMLTIIPAVSIAISTIPMFFYDYIGEKKEKILAELNERVRKISAPAEPEEV